MTQSITNQEPGSGIEISTPALRGMIGYILYMSCLITAMFSPLLTTESTKQVFEFGFVRAASLLCTAACFFMIARLIPDRDKFIRSKKVKVAIIIGQIPLPILGIIEMMCGVEIPFAAMLASWLLWGTFIALQTSSWIDAKANLPVDESTSMSYWSFAAAAGIMTIVLAVEHIVGIYCLLIMILISGGILLKTPPREETDSTANIEWLRSKNAFAPSGSYIMFVDGAILTLCAGFCITSVILDELEPFTLGLVIVASAAYFFFLRKINPPLLSLRRSQLFFMPLICVALIALGFTTGYYALAAALILMSVLYLFDFANQSLLALRGVLLSISPAYSYCSGRIPMTVGHAMGWLIFACTPFFPDNQALPIVTTAMIALLGIYFSVCALNPLRFRLLDYSDMSTDPIIEDIPEATSAIQVDRPYKNKCVKVTQAYDLTAREGEILSYLAKGRNAKYIADQLFVAERTVKTHIYHIYQKMGIHSQQELMDIVDNS